ncbi:MAG: amidase [Bacteroidia bacterium]|nr:MAG: amidase [Bacteroidia bacterium]
MKIIAFLMLAFVVVTSAQTVRYMPKKEDLRFTFGGHPPVMTLKPGTTLETWTEDCYDGAVKSPTEIPTQVAPLGRDNPQTGPFYIEGAEPGDILVVHILDLSPAKDHGISSHYPGFGALTGTEYTALLTPFLPEKLWWYEVDRKRNVVRTTMGSHVVEIPMSPFLGGIGIAPQRGEVRWTVTPEAFGGNMDYWEIKKGATVYLPIHVSGALLQFGDGHLAQGEGEIIGTAVESSLNVRLKVDVIKGRTIAWPRVENDEYLMATGSYRPLEDAVRIAYKELIDWLVTDYGLDRMDAYQLCSQVGVLDIAQVVDPNYTAVAKIHKKYLPPGKAFGGMHERIKH